MSQNTADKYSSAAAGSAVAGAAGGFVWRNAAKRKNAARVTVAENANWPADQRLSEVNAAAAAGKTREIRNLRSVASRREALAARTRARLVPKKTKSKVERYTEPGRSGFYPVNRLRAMDASAEGNRMQARALEFGVKANQRDSRKLGAQAASSKVKHAAGLRDVARSSRMLRAGRVGALAGAAGAVGFGIAAERSKDRKKNAPVVELKRMRPNVIDMDRYRSARPSADERGSTLVDFQGYRKPLSANAGSTWLKNHGRQS